MKGKGEKKVNVNVQIFIVEVTQETVSLLCSILEFLFPCKEVMD